MLIIQTHRNKQYKFTRESFSNESDSDFETISPERQSLIDEIEIAYKNAVPQDKSNSKFSERSIVTSQSNLELKIWLANLQRMKPSPSNFNLNNPNKVTFGRDGTSPLEMLTKRLNDRVKEPVLTTDRHGIVKFNRNNKN